MRDLCTHAKRHQSQKIVEPVFGEEKVKVITSNLEQNSNAEGT